MVISGEKNKNRLRQKVQYPLIGAELIEPTIKETPNSPKQSYALTEKFKAYMNKKNKFLTSPASFVIEKNTLTLTKKKNYL